MAKTYVVSMIAALAACSARPAAAVPGYLDLFTTRYGTAGTVLDRCTLCHGPAGPPLNPYGSDFAAAGHGFAAIEGKDSDGDGFGNLVEIDARTLPGSPKSFPGAVVADTKKPKLKGFTIPRVAGALAVPIQALVATDNVGVTGYFLSEAKKPAPLAADPGWSATPPTSFTFSAPGRRKLFVWARDAAGNVSHPKKRTVRITLPPA